MKSLIALFIFLLSLTTAPIMADVTITNPPSATDIPNLGTGQAVENNDNLTMPGTAEDDESVNADNYGDSEGLSSTDDSNDNGSNISNSN